LITLPAAHPDQAVHTVAEPDKDLIAEARRRAGGDAVVQGEYGADSDMPALQELYFDWERPACLPWCILSVW
jgi:hypothetical protein